MLCHPSHAPPRCAKPSFTGEQVGQSGLRTLVIFAAESALALKLLPPICSRQLSGCGRAPRSVWLLVKCHSLTSLQELFLNDMCSMCTYHMSTFSIRDTYSRSAHGPTRA